jgi:hypothetical protein
MDCEASNWIASLALIVAVASAIFTALSWKAAARQAQAAIFEQRYKVYADARAFLRPWFAKGRPDIGQLGLIIGAWERPQFLFPASVTVFLRQFWLCR